MIKKKILAATIMAGLGLSLSAYAIELTIVNNTSKPSTSLINSHKFGGGICSASLPSSIVKGVTPPGEEQTISSTKLFTICILDKQNCKAEVFATDHCGSGGEAPIITVILDVNTGIKEVTPPTSGYKVDWSSNKITISDGSELARK
jgi:hypothetical protein